MKRLQWRATTRPRPWAATGTGIVAILAFAGAAGLGAGTLGLGPEITARFPFGSGVFAGVALALIVGVPMAVTSWWTARPDPRASVAAVVSGILLLGWVVVEMGVIQTYSWLQPVLALAGVAIAYAGLRDVRSTE